MHRTTIATGMILLMMGVVGCSGTAREVSQGAYRDVRTSTRTDDGHLIRQVYDMNGDGRIDLWKFYASMQKTDQEGAPERVLVRKEVDINFDGTIDRIMYYSQNEDLVSEEIDTNFDGIIDRIQYYTNGFVVKTEVYTADCNRVRVDSEERPEVNPNLTRHFRKGVLTRESFDSKCSGKEEMLTIFNEKGEVSQIGYDRDADGVIDQWVKY